jgi:hypothetical protein
MAAINRQALRDQFNEIVAAIWETWLEHVWPKHPRTNPFDHWQFAYLMAGPDSDELRRIAEDRGYVLGIHHALGWSLENPEGPKEWSPK